MSDDDKKPKKTAVDALRGTHYMMYPEEIVIIGLDTADDDKHPLYDARIHRPITEESIANVNYYGVLKTVDCKKDGDKVICVDGRGRVRRARAVNVLRKQRGEEPIRVPVMIRRGDDAQLFGMSRAANLHDADGPMLNAKNAQRMLDMGKTLTEVALTFGVSEQTIRNWTATLDLAPEVIDAMIKNELTHTAAVQLATLPKAEQVATLEEIKSETKDTGEKPTVEKVKRKVAEKAGKAPGKTPKERIESARNLLVKYTGITSPTKEDMAGIIERVCRVLTGKGLDKLATEE